MSRDKYRRDTRDPLIARLHAERVVLGMTQKEVATSGGLARNTVGTLENGKRGASLAMFRRYARAMGYTLALVPIEEDES